MSGSLAGTIADLTLRGISPRQVHDPAWPLEQRPVTYSCRGRRNPELDDTGPFLIDDPVDELFGDDLGWHVWTKGSRACSGWFGGPAPSVVVRAPGGGGGADSTGTATSFAQASGATSPNELALLPLFGQDHPDDTFKEAGARLPDWAGLFPVGWTGTRAAGTDHLSQQETWHPDALGLVAVNKAGNPDVGTRVFDVDGESRVDRWAYLQSLLSVVDLTDGICGLGGRALALQLGPGGKQDGGTGYLPMVDHAARTVGLGSSVAGGPFTLGGAGCVHKAGQDRDGYSRQPVHLSTDALFILEEGTVGGGGGEGDAVGTFTGTRTRSTAPGGTSTGGASGTTRASSSKDAPIWFDRGEWQKTQPDGPHWVRGYVRLDPNQVHNAGCVTRPGKWAVEVPSTIYIPDPGRQGGSQDLVFNPFALGVLPGAVGLVTGQGFGYGNVDGATPVVGQGGYRPAYAHATNCLITPGGGVKASPTAAGSPAIAGSTVVTDEERADFEAWPLVVCWGGYGQGSGNVGGWEQDYGSDLTYPAATGALVFHPPDVTLWDVVNCEAESSYTATVTFPTGLAQLGLGCPHQQTGGVSTGFTITTNSSGDLLFQSMDSDGAVTATATLSHGATSLGGVGGSTGSTDNAVLRANGTGGNSVQAGSGVTLEDDDTFLHVDGVQLDPNSGVSTSMSGSYGIYCSDEGFGSSYKLQFSRPGPTTWQIPALDTSGAAGDTVLALNSAATAWELVTKASLAGALDDLSDVTITSPAQYQILQYDGANWGEVSKLDMVNDPGSIGSSYPAHELEDNHSSSSTDITHTLAIRATGNNYAFGVCGTGISFYGKGGTYCGTAMGWRTGSSTGDLRFRASTNADLFSVRDVSSQQRCVFYGDGITAYEDTLTSGSYTPEGSGFGHHYYKNSIYYINLPGGGGEVIVAGTGSVQEDLANSDIVGSSASADGETYVYDSGTGLLEAKNVHEIQDSTGSGGTFRKIAETTVSATAASASVTATNIIPAACRVIAVFVTVNTGLGTTNGTTGYTVGDGVTANRWGTDTAATTAGTSTGPNTYGTTSDRCCFWNTSAQSVVITAVGGNFDGTGLFHVVIVYEEVNEPTS